MGGPQKDPGIRQVGKAAERQSSRASDHQIYVCRYTDYTEAARLQGRHRTGGFLERGPAERCRSRRSAEAYQGGWQWGGAERQSSGQRGGEPWAQLSGEGRASCGRARAARRCRAHSAVSRASGSASQQSSSSSLRPPGSWEGREAGLMLASSVAPE